MKLFTDQMGRTVALSAWPPRRIVSLVPSQTELLADLGLEAEVVGITKFCVHPANWFQQKKRVGGTKTVSPDKVAALAPDLIIGNKEENEQTQIEALAARYPVWMSDIRNLKDALDMIGGVGELTGKPEAAKDLVHRIEQDFDALHMPAAGLNPLKIAYLIWRKPYMVAAGDTFIDEMLRVAGFHNVFGHLNRYPEISLEELAARQPEAIFLSSEPFPFAEKHFGPVREVCPAARIMIVDGEMFSWYGSRLQYAPAYFRQLWETLGLAATEQNKNAP